MGKNRILIVVALAVLPGITGPQTVHGAPPWADLVRLRHIEAEPEKAYVLAEENGPWMIMATTFQGPDAAQDAHRLVYELRSQFKMPAYVHDKVFDYSESFIGRGVDKYGQPRRMRHQKNDKIQEVAVLVGDYTSVDDPQAQKDLKKIKSLRPKSLAPPDGRETSQTFSQLRDFHRKLLPDDDTRRKQGPMRLAFVTTNPMLSPQYFRPRGIDQFVERLNRGTKHSLLDCPGQYTVRVATFNGLVATNPETIRAATENRMESSRLEDGARKAHQLAVALRAKGYEAYQFHDRNSSIVTVGSFLRPPVQRPDGSLTYEPQVVDLIRRFGAKQKTPQQLSRTSPAPVASSIQPAALIGIPFDVHPTLIEVPKRSLSADYARQPTTFR